MIVKEAYRDRTHACCRAHYNGGKPLPEDAPALGPVEDARETACEFCDDGLMRILDLRDLPGPLLFHAPIEDQGQMVEISYAGLYDGTVLRRTHDRADRSTTYAVGEIDWDEEPEGETPGLNAAPHVIEWEPCQVCPRNEEAE